MLLTATIIFAAMAKEKQNERRHRIMTYNQQAAMRSRKGAQNRKKGEVFEDYIIQSCENYRDKHLAFIEKTPEPFKITRSLGKGKFEGHFAKAAQPDFKGTLCNGGAIVFDAKVTDTGKIPLSALTDEQAECLAEHSLLGAEAGVLISYSFRVFAYIPIGIFMRAKELNGHAHWTEKDAEPYAVLFKGGYIDFLKGVIDV